MDPEQGPGGKPTPCSVSEMADVGLSWPTVLPGTRTGGWMNPLRLTADPRLPNDQGHCKMPVLIESKPNFWLKSPDHPLKQPRQQDGILSLKTIIRWLCPEEMEVSDVGRPSLEVNFPQPAQRQTAVRLSTAQAGRRWVCHCDHTQGRAAEPPEWTCFRCPPICVAGRVKTSRSSKEIKHLSARPKFSKATREDTDINLSLILFTIVSQLNSFLKSGGVDINEVNSKLVARLRTDVSDVSEDGWIHNSKGSSFKKSKKKDGKICQKQPVWNSKT